MGNTDQSRLRCDQRAPDNIVDGKWHRLIGNSGTKIPETCVPMRRCGTHAPGWLNGTHPQLQEGQVNRKVCYHWSSRCCNWQNNIKVRSCGDFYVYNLIKPPNCWLRYCGDNNAGMCKILTQFSYYHSFCFSILFCWSPRINVRDNRIACAGYCLPETNRPFLRHVHPLIITTRLRKVSFFSDV